MNRMLIFLLLLLTVSAPCHARIVQEVYEIRVLVLNYKTGRPVPRWEVEMKLPDAKGEIHDFPVGTFRETDESGIAVFQIKAPTPLRIGASTRSACAAQGVFDTSEVLQQGLIGDFELCKHTKSGTVTAQPGQIVVYTHLPTLWQRIQHFFDNIFPSYC